MTVMAGAVLLAYLLSSTQVRERHQYQPSAPKGDVVVRVDGAEPRDVTGQSATAAATARVARVLGATRAAVYTDLQAAAPGHAAEETGPLSVRDSCAVSSSSPDGSGACAIGQVAAGDTSIIDVAAGRHVAEAAQVLAAGGAVVFQRGITPGGVVTVDAERPSDNSSTSTAYRLHALVIETPAYPELPAAVVAPATATRLGWVGVSTTGIVDPPKMPSRATQDRIAKLLGSSGMLYVERGYEKSYGVVLLALIVASGLVTAAGTSIAVALAMSEARADFATLSAVGAPPSRRRRQAMAQTAVVGVLGSVLGLALGSLVGVGVMGGSTSYPMTVPVRWLLEIAAAAPVLALLVAGVVSGGRLTLTRRPT
jgi:putative ABC transport system permease protein